MLKILVDPFLQMVNGTYVFLRKRGWQDMNLVIPDEHVDRVALEVDSLQEFHD
jgi:hypothetical protein